MQQLEDAFGAVEIPHGVLPQVAQTGCCRERGPGQIRRSQRDEYLTTVGRCKQTRQTIQTGSEVVPFLRRGGSGMQRHADPGRTIASGQISCTSARCASRAAAIASGAVGNAAWTASPTVLKW